MNVLLIDKEETLLDLLEELIEFPDAPSDLHIEKAHTFEDATQRALHNNPDLVIVDPMFSHDGGMALIKTIKDAKPGIRIIALSNCSQGEGCPPFCKEQCLEAGADRHYDKQKDFMQIPAIVREYYHLLQSKRIVA